MTKPDPNDLAETVRRQADQIERLLSALERQARVVETLLGSGGRVAAVVDTPTVAAREAVTMADIVPRYLKSLGDVTWLPVAMSQLRHVLAWFAPSVCFRAEEGRRNKVPVLGPDMAVADMRAYHWDDFREWMRANVPGVSPRVRDLILIRARAVLNWAVSGERIPKNPFEGVKKEQRPKKRGTRIMDDSVEKVRPVASAVAWAYILTICDSGMRPNEARLLRWDQIDRETGKVSLDETQTKGRVARSVWVTPRCLEAYEPLPRYEGNPYVFGAKPRGKSKKHRPLSKATIWRHFRAAANAAGLVARVGDGSVHAHDGRRGYATKLIKLNGSLHKVQKILGHKHVSTTEWYVDLEDEDLEETHNLLTTAKRLPAQRATEKPDPDPDDTKK